MTISIEGGGRVGRHCLTHDHTIASSPELRRRAHRPVVREEGDNRATDDEANHNLVARHQPLHRVLQPPLGDLEREVLHWLLPDRLFKTQIFDRDGAVSHQKRDTTAHSPSRAHDHLPPASRLRQTAPWVRHASRVCASTRRRSCVVCGENDPCFKKKEKA